MASTLFADMPTVPFMVACFGGFIVAGVAAATGIAWLGLWLVRRGQRNADRASEGTP